MNNTKEQLKEWWNENKNDIWQKVKTGVKVTCLAVGSYKLGQFAERFVWQSGLLALREVMPDLPIKDLLDPSKYSEIMDEVTKKLSEN